MTSAPISVASSVLRFSVIVTNHNYGDYLAEAVESALRQSHAPDEIIVVDDGSSDRSGEVLDALQQQHPQLQIVRKKNGGQLSAFIAGAQLAKGDVLAFLDADDIWTDHYLATIAKRYIADRSIDFVYTDLELFGERSGKMGMVARDQDLGLSVLAGSFNSRWQGSATSAMSLRRTLAARILDLPPHIVSDWRTRADNCLVFGADILGGHKYALQAPLVRYRAHGANAWLDRDEHSLVELRFSFQNERLLEYYRQRAGISRRLLRYAKMEFRTKTPPTFKQYRAYSRLLGQSELTWNKRLEHRVAMLRYLFANRPK